VRRLILASILITAIPASAQSLASDDFLRSVLTRCEDLEIKRSPYTRPLPAGMKGELVEAESASPYCHNDVAVIASRGELFIGNPWPLSGNGTLEEKVRNFSWNNFREVFTASVVPSKTATAIKRVKVTYTTEAGAVPIDGWTDANESTLFVGEFYAANASVPAERMKKVTPLLAAAPRRGNPSSKVTIVEFSDFQCPSCREASKYMKPLIEKLGDKVHYVRLDLPLISSHPWAFQAAVAGRAIHRQNPDAFWKYRDFVYENQPDLNAFTLEDQARKFAADQGLDLARYDSDLQSPALRDEILKNVGTAFTMGMQSTPTFLVNGVSIYPGKDGSALEKYVSTLLK
jgi:protein-disulfide isomerase